MRARALVAWNLRRIADDARAREVGLRHHSSCEAGEQSGAIRCGAGGAKGGDQGECGLAKHAPDSEPGLRVTGAGPHAASIERPPHRTVRAAFPHTAPTSGPNGKSLSNERPYRVPLTACSRGSFEAARWTPLMSPQRKPKSQYCSLAGSKLKKCESSRPDFRLASLVWGTSAIRRPVIFFPNASGTVQSMP